MTIGKLGDMKCPKSTDLLEDYDHSYSADGRSDVDSRPWHFKEGRRGCGMKGVRMNVTVAAGQYYYSCIWRPSCGITRSHGPTL
jgi:hypothetical protein